MAKKYYIPTSDTGKLIWIKNFNSKLSGYAALFGITAAELASLNADTLILIYILDILEIFKTELHERTAYKDLLRDGPLGKVIGAIPTLPTLPVAPTPVQAGIFPRITTLVRRIKSNTNYTETIGKDLGIIGADMEQLTIDQKPTLTVAQEGGKVLIKYKKGENLGIQLFSRRANETEFTFLSVVTKTSYKDPRPNLVPGQAEARQYQAWFIQEDEIIGQVSDIVSTTI